MKFRSVSLFAVPFLVLTSFSSVFAATKIQTAKTFERKSNSEQVLLAGFFDDLGDEIKDSVEKEVNGIFNSDDNSIEKPQTEDTDLQEQTEEIQTSENESIELEQLTNINPASTKAKTGSAANDLTLFCNMDYAKEAAEATSQSEIQSITSEASDNNCLFETEAGSELKYQYLGEQKYGIVLVGQNNNGQPYFGITKAKNIQTEEQLSSSSEDDTTASSESSRDRNEPIDVGQFANISSTSPDLKTSYSTRDKEMLCMDYLVRIQEATGDFKKQMSIRNEASEDKCRLIHYAGSPFSYKQIGNTEDNRYLLVINFEGRDFYQIVGADGISAEAPEYVPESGQLSMAELKQLLDRRSGETDRQWNGRVYQEIYQERVTGEEYRAWKKTLSSEDIQAYDTATRQKHEERGEIGDMVNDDVRDAFLGNGGGSSSDVAPGCIGIDLNGTTESCNQRRREMLYQGR